MCALSPNNNEVWIYETKGSDDFKQWTRKFVLAEVPAVLQPHNVKSNCGYSTQGSCLVSTGAQSLVGL